MAQIWREDIVTGVDRILHVANEMGETDLMKPGSWPSNRIFKSYEDNP